MNFFQLLLHFYRQKYKVRMNRIGRSEKHNFLYYRVLSLKCNI